MTAPHAAETAPPITLAPERPEDAAQVAGLIERGFGPGRFAKAAERLREGSQPLADICWVAWSGDRMVGCVKMWPIHIGDQPATFLGPFAVDRAFRGLGVGRSLIRKVSEAAREAGHGLILLVGKAPYFAQLGFQPVAPGRIDMPGPVDPKRLLTLALREGADADLSGRVRAG